MAGLFKKIFSQKGPKAVAPAAKPELQTTPILPEPVSGPELLQVGEISRIKLGVVVGHERKAGGATMAAPYKTSEYFWNTDLASRMKEYARVRYPNLSVEIFFRDGVGVSGAYSKVRSALCDCAIELHFNAFNSKAYGTTTLCSPASDDVAFAQIIQKQMVTLYGRLGKADRGVKTLSKGDRGGATCHAVPGTPNCLIEPFFGDNPEEAKLAHDKKEALAKALVDGVMLWAKKVDLIKD